MASLPLYKESAKVSQLKTKVREAETELDLAVAQLQAFREKKPASQDTSLQQVLLMSQLKDVEARLNGVGMVRTLGAPLSSYTGTIKKIKWLEQTNQGLHLELTFVFKEPL